MYFCHSNFKMKHRLKYFNLIFFTLIALPQVSLSQSGIFNYFNDIIIKTDTASFNSKTNLISVSGEKAIAFKYTQDNQQAELLFFPKQEDFLDSISFRLLSSTDFEITDSLIVIEKKFLRARIRFKNISNTEFLMPIIEITKGDKKENYGVRLFAHTQTTAQIYIGNDDFYVGEEKRFEIITNNLNNLKLSGEWESQNGIEFRLFEADGKGFIDIVSNDVGEKKLILKIKTKRPHLNKNNIVSFELLPLNLEFNVRSSRLTFLRIDQREIIRFDDVTEGVEIQLDNHRNLQLNKTYRIENREERGGPLVGEIFTVRRLSNDKVLSIFRPYHYHRVTQGYLYIKDGDNPLFLTNVNIIPDAKIYKLSLLKGGKNWTEDRTVKPGETIDVKIEGVGLDMARFYFEDMEDISSDSLIRNDRVTYFRLKVPINNRKNSIQIYNNNKPTGYSLSVVEHQKPRILDFVYLNYGETEKQITHLNQPIFYNKTIRDVVISFDELKIDEGGVLYGKQFLEIEVRVIGTRDELIEMQKVDFIEVCPGDNSPRHAFYSGNSCNKSDIRLNAILNRKTHSLDEWSKIEVTIRHKKDRYGGDGYSQKILIVMQQRVTFDVDLSFPAGLLIKKIGDNSLPGLSGISLAMIAQFSFYEKDKIRRFKPYKIGAGFLAQNAFNFNPDANRDLGLIVIGSVYPTRKEAKLSFPLYGGFGYFLNESKFFYLIGPGIRVNF
jgi:hypothetical protein